MAVDDYSSINKRLDTDRHQLATSDTKSYEASVESTDARLKDLEDQNEVLRVQNLNKV